MKRISTDVRPNWQKKVEEIGFMFHTLDDIYWDESAYYEFSYSQIEELETATNKLFEMCLEAVQYVIDKKKYSLFHIPQKFVPFIEHSWNEEHPSIYGRFDFAYDGVFPPKLLEFNADTPTSLFESAIVQWYWSQEFCEGVDQFNSIHEKLVDYWSHLKEYLHSGIVHFASIKESMEDYITTEYLRDTAIQGGLETEFLHIEEIGWNKDKKAFVDLQEREMKNIFKLYPWEWMVHEEFGENILTDKNKTFWIEPAWKMILSNKAILVILSELFPLHKYLLPAYFDSDKFFNRSFVKKPLLSREGANISLVKDGKIILETEGEYGEEGFVYQQLYDLPNFNGNYPIIGSWLIGGESAGIGIRETKTLITDNCSRYLPHIIKKK